LATKCKYKSLVQVSSRFEDSKKKSYQILSKFKPLGFSEFAFNIHFENEEVSMEKVVPLLKTFKTIFYFKIFNQGKVLFGSKGV
jgi:hypothetical protein